MKLAAPSPRGAEIELTYRLGGETSRQTGELIEVREGDLLVLFSEGFTRVVSSAFLRATFEGTTGVGTLEGAGTPEQRERLAQFSRYPLGLTAEHLELLLATRGQGRLIEVGG